MGDYRELMIEDVQQMVEESINPELIGFVNEKIIDAEYNAMHEKGIPWLFGSGKGYFNWRLKFDEEINKDIGSMF